MIGKLIQMFIWLLLVPYAIGLLLEEYRSLTLTDEETDFDEKEVPRTKSPKLLWRFGGIFKPGYNLMIGYIMMWAIFQFCAVPYIFGGYKLSALSTCFTALCTLLTVCAIIGFFRIIKTCDWKEFITDKIKHLKNKEWDKTRLVLLTISWGIFIVLLLFQLYQSFVLAYADGDDAYYISLSTAANLGGSMYLLDPYTGVPTTFDARHGLAPFPMWISFIADKMGVNAAVAAHTWIPLFLIPLTYVIYFQIGTVLLKERKHYISVFLNFVALLQIFGNYSIYPASTFLLTRTRQGKAALGNIILPFLIYLLLVIAEEVKEKGKATRTSVFRMFILSFAACLCSTMSGFLMMLLAGVVVFWLYMLYKKKKIISQYLLACLPCILYALLYFASDWLV